MDFIRIGRSLRAIWLRAGQRQVDVARRAGVSREMLLRIEGGAPDAVTVAGLDAVCRILNASLEIFIRHGGSDLDRMLNAGHAALHEVVARQFIALGWEIAPEVSFSRYGERGVIDIVAWHAATRTLLVIELKTEIVDVSALMGTVDRYRRNAAAAVAERGWIPATVGCWVAVAESATNRRRLAEHRITLRAAFPADGRRLRAWLRDPDGQIRALSFISSSTVTARTNARGSRKRVRRPAPSPAGSATGPAARPRT